MAKRSTGRKIVGRKLEIRGTGGTFSKDMELLDPTWLDGLDVGDETTVALRISCIDEHFPAEDPSKPSEGGQIRKLVFVAGEVVLVDDSLVAPIFASHADAVQKAKDDAKGNTTVQQQILDALEAAHLDGKHGLAVDGDDTIVGKQQECPLCDWEDETADAEAAAAT